jgi:hypothetical protein
MLVAAMRASTTYHMRSQLQCVGNTLTSADSTFTTGALPASPTFPSAQVSRSNPSLSALENPGVELISGIATRPNEMQAFVMDRDANPIWYYDVGAENGSYPFNVKLLPNGYIILSIVTPTDSVLREVDLAGTTIREMKVTALAQKMQAAGFNSLGVRLWRLRSPHFGD